MLLVWCHRHRVFGRVKCLKNWNTVWIEIWFVTSSSEWLCRWKTCVFKLKVTHTYNDHDGYHNQKERPCYIAYEIFHCLHIKVLRQTLIGGISGDTELLICDFTSTEGTRIFNWSRHRLTAVDDDDVIVNVPLRSIDNRHRLYPCIPKTE